jgi:hypothetical protein
LASAIICPDTSTPIEKSCGLPVRVHEPEAVYPEPQHRQHTEAVVTLFTLPHSLQQETLGELSQDPAATAPLRSWPQLLLPDRIERLVIDRQDRLGGVIHEYHQAA